MNAESNQFQQMVVLRSSPYREYDLLVELFTKNSGKVSAVVNGARRPKSSLKAVIQPFNLFSAHLIGKNELKRLSSVDLLETYSFSPQVSFCAMYLNEILFYLLEKNIPQINVFDSYVTSLQYLQKVEFSDTELPLRMFELNLLDELGYGIDFSCDCHGKFIDDGQLYIYDPLSGFVSVPSFAGDATISGILVKKLGKHDFADQDVLKKMKGICQKAINIHLGNHQLMSRELLKKFMSVKSCV